jgi:hypothetical protein
VWPALPLAIALAQGALIPRPTAAPSAGPPHATGKGIAISCTLPFDAIKVHHPIDDSCPATGASTPNTPQAAQNEAKNGFCSSGVPVSVTFATLRQLQAEAASKVTFGSDAKLPKDRSLLKNLPSPSGTIGEGTLVRLAAYVIDAHYSNVGAGESVNCKQPDKDSNDIHIVLGERSNKDDECSSATAEMSPHFRPAAWIPTNLNDNNAHLYRFTGHLFFDGSHQPCSGGQGPNPKRSSLWEIHPVYGVDLCMEPSNKCSVESDVGWVSLSEHIGVETRLRAPERRRDDAEFISQASLRNWSLASYH